MNPPKKKTVNICAWNIRRGLVIREEEIKSLVRLNSLNIVFLVETDTSAINSETDYRIPGFKTLIQKKDNAQDHTRILCLIDEKMSSNIVIRSDLSSADFPSLWVEIENRAGKNILCGGFYREWAPKGLNTIDAQVRAIQVFTRQLELASQESKSVVVMGDANLCSLKWDSPSFTLKRISEELKDTLTQCGLLSPPMGITYTADRVGEDGMEITSALDHVYHSEDLVSNLRLAKLDNSSTDHLPIVAKLELSCDNKSSRKKQKAKSIWKRSMRNFTKTRWLDCLRYRDWSRVSSLEDVNEKTQEFTSQINAALDECAPFKKFKIRDNFKPGLTDETKRMMRERDETRKKIATTQPEDKPAIRAKYKQLRNRCIAQIRRDTLNRNGELIAGAKNEGETWRVVNEIIKPRSNIAIIINGTDGEISDEQEVANAFNGFFISKIDTLKENIDPNQVRDPLEKIKEKMKNKNLKLKLKLVSTKTVKKLMKSMAAKKSKGNDGVPQDCLLLGQEVIVNPLTNIINTSIEAGSFLNCGKRP